VRAQNSEAAIGCGLRFVNSVDARAACTSSASELRAPRPLSCCAAASAAWRRRAGGIAGAAAGQAGARRR